MRTSLKAAALQSSTSTVTLMGGCHWSNTLCFSEQKSFLSTFLHRLDPSSAERPYHFPIASMHLYKANYAFPKLFLMFGVHESFPSRFFTEVFASWRRALPNESGGNRCIPHSLVIVWFSWKLTNKEKSLVIHSFHSLSARASQWEKRDICDYIHSVKQSHFSFSLFDA